MSISSEHSVVYLMGNGTAQRFDFDFRIFAKGDLSVYVDGALQTLDSDYEVKSDTLLPDGITYDWSSGGYVYFDPGSIPADGSEVIIRRALAFTQHLDLQPGGEIPPENVERALDRLTMICQELEDELERTILHPMTIQYSIDGETGWTNEPTSDAFIYFRVSTDGGLTWSEPMIYGTEYAAYKWAENPEDIEVEPGKYSALHHSAKAAISAVNASQSADDAEAYATDASQSASEAFGASAPAWDSATSYNYPDVVAYTNGHTYRCIGTNVTEAPNIDGTDNEAYWTRVTVQHNEYFEYDGNGDLMPMIVPLMSEHWVLDSNGDIMPK